MRHIEALIPDWLDDRLDAAAREEVREHCAACADCRAALAQSEAVWALLGASEVPFAPPVWPGVAAALGRREPTWLRLGYPLAAAAMLVLGIFLGGRFAGEGAAEVWTTGEEIVSGTALAGDAAWSLDDLVSVALVWNDEEN